MNTEQTVAVAPAGQPLNTQLYLHTLSSGLGIHMQDIPLEVVAACIQQTTKAEINRLVMDWYKARPKAQALVVSDEDKAMFKTLVSPENSTKARELEAQIARYLNEALNRINDGQTRLVHAAQTREELHTYLGRGATDLTAEVMKTCADGWYTYDSEQTKAHNTLQQARGRSSSQGLIFITKPVTISYYNKAAAVEMMVPLGQYKVLVTPGLNSIVVSPFRDNIFHSGYFHPHVGEVDTSRMGGAVCWGNAANTYTQAMNSLEFSKAMHALRIIFTTYNDASPYVSITTLHQKLNPQLRANGPVEYKQYGTKAVWVSDEGIPSDYDRSQQVSTLEAGDTDEEGNDVREDRTLTRVYRLLHLGTQNRVAGTYYFVKKTDGTFYEIEESDTYGWDS